ncbi:MAG: hypothetical protein AABX77_01285 [Nanoarchaeota archaeon]
MKNKLEEGAENSGKGYGKGLGKLIMISTLGLAGISLIHLARSDNFGVYTIAGTSLVLGAVYLTSSYFDKYNKIKDK